MPKFKSLTNDDLIEPVFYCKDCLSMHVVCEEALVTDEWDGTMCGKCGSTNIGSMPFGDWLSMNTNGKDK